LKSKKRIVAERKTPYDLTMETSMMLNEEKCWDAVTKRSASQDGRFYFGVVTTGVYCRPSCAARQPLRKNVRFYESPADAERDGLRPCLRCHPLDGRADEETIEKIRRICGYIREHCDSGDSLTLDTLGEAHDWSPFHLHRTFKAVLGVTPKQFLDACRLSTFKAELRKGGSVTAAVYDAGFGSSSRVYERVDNKLGITPGEYRAGGKNVSISYAFAKTPLGLLLVAATARGLCSVQFGESTGRLLQDLLNEYPHAVLAKNPTDSPELDAWMQGLTKYLQGEPAALDFPIDIRATAFQLKVWRYLQTIPVGEVRTYGEVAKAIGDPGASRAVGTACGANKVALVIPCHRVIRGDHGMGGYRWGLERKIALLASEKKRYTALER
jgi:AraC family transcriptional regulator of adaptative response/methylated-DNA-[protein]-cysteine methyltransferase